MLIYSSLLRLSASVARRKRPAVISAPVGQLTFKLTTRDHCGDAAQSPLNWRCANRESDVHATTPNPTAVLAHSRISAQSEDHDNPESALSKAQPLAPATGRWPHRRPDGPDQHGCAHRQSGTAEFATPRGPGPTTSVRPAPSRERQQLPYLRRPPRTVATIEPRAAAVTAPTTPRAWRPSPAHRPAGRGGSDRTHDASGLAIRTPPIARPGGAAVTAPTTPRAWQSAPRPSPGREGRQ